MGHPGCPTGSHGIGAAFEPQAGLGYDPHSVCPFESATMTPARPLRHHRLRALPVVLACVLALAGTSALGQGNSKAAKFYEDALARYEKNDIPGTIIQLKNALQIDKNQLAVQLLLGRVLMRNGEVAAAEVALGEALRLGVNRAEVVVLLGQAYLAQGKHRLILEQNTFNPAGLAPGIQMQLHLLRASTQAELGDTQSALRSIDEARAINSRHIDSWLAEVPIRIRIRQLDQANTAADKALALDPASADAIYMKGSVLHVRGDLRGALAAYERVLRTDATHVEARVARIGILMDQARHADASLDITELRRTAPREPRGAYLAALMAERNGNAQAVSAALKEVTDLLDPIPLDYIRFRPQLLMLNGLSHFGLNQSEKAQQYLVAFQRVVPNSPVSKLLARIYLSDGKPDLAISVLDTYLRAEPGDGQALTLLATAHMASGRPARATALMQEALKAKDNPAFRTALGMSLVSGGKAGDGIQELEAAYRKDPQQLQAATALVQLYLRSGQSRKAIPITERLVKLQPANADFHNMQGMALGQSGNVAGSRAAFEKSLQINPASTAAKLNLARLDIATRQLGAAGKRLEELLKQEPRNSEAMYELAVIADRTGQQATAQRWLEQARDTGGSKELRWDLALVDFHLRGGRAAPAFEAAKAASAKAPENLETQMAYARAQLATGDAAGARSTLSAATRYAEYDPAQQVRVANLQLLANNPAGAAYSLNKALSTRPDFLPALAMLVEAELRQGEIAQAEKRAAAIAAQYPRRAIGHSLVGDVALARNQPGAAAEAYRRAHQAEPGSASLLRLFGALATQDGGKAAIQLAEQWLKTHPQDQPVRKALADSYARAGDFARARLNYEAAAKANPADAEVLNNLANVMLRLKDPAAVKTAEAALAQAPGNALYTDTLGWVLFHNGQTDRALQMLRDARLRQPDNPEIRYHLAAVLAQTGRRNEARDELEAAMATGKSFDGVSDAQKLLLSLR